MKFKFFLKPFGLKSMILFNCLLVSSVSVLPVTAQAGSIFFPSNRYYENNQDDNRYRDRQSYNNRQQNRAVDFYYSGNRNRRRYNDYNRDRGYRSSDEYCPDNSYSDYSDRGRRTYQRPRGFGFVYYGKQR